MRNLLGLVTDLKASHKSKREKGWRWLETIHREWYEPELEIFQGKWMAPFFGRKGLGRPLTSYVSTFTERESNTRDEWEKICRKQPSVLARTKASCQGAIFQKSRSLSVHPDKNSLAEMNTKTLDSLWIWNVAAPVGKLRPLHWDIFDTATVVRRTLRPVGHSQCRNVEFNRMSENWHSSFVVTKLDFHKQYDTTRSVIWT